MEDVISPKKFPRVAVNRVFSSLVESLWLRLGCVWPGDAS